VQCQGSHWRLEAEFEGNAVLTSKGQLSRIHAYSNLCATTTKKKPKKHAYVAQHGGACL
jgi:hypothetical protein